MVDSTILIQQTGTINRTDAITQFVPELMIKAADIIKSVEIVIDRHPQHQDRLIKLRDLKLQIVKQTYLCDQVQMRIDRVKRETATQVLEWAKNKSFGALLGKDGLLDMKKGQALIKSWGAVRMKSALQDYNDQLVPYANRIQGTEGVWSPAETQQARALQDLQRQHNALAMSLKKVLV